MTRHLYYLQLKDNVLNYHHDCQEEKCFQIAGYALQADFGNYITATEMQEYFDPREYFPSWVGCCSCSVCKYMKHSDLQTVTWRWYYKLSFRLLGLLLPRTRQLQVSLTHTGVLP